MAKSLSLLLLINTGILFTSLFIDNRLLLFISVIVLCRIVLAFLFIYKIRQVGYKNSLLSQQSAGGRQSEEAMSVRYELEKTKKFVSYLSVSHINCSKWSERMIKSFHRMRNGRETFRTNEQVNVYKSAIRSLNFIRMHILPAFERMEKCNNYIVN